MLCVDCTEILMGRNIFFSTYTCLGRKMQALNESYTEIKKNSFTPLPKHRNVLDADTTFDSGFIRLAQSYSKCPVRCRQGRKDKDRSSVAPSALGQAPSITLT